MSQFNTLSKDFKESLEELGDQLRAKKEQDSEDAVKLASKFIEGPFAKWYDNLDDESKSEVRRVLGEVGQLSHKDVMAIMESEKSATPLGFLDSLFAVSDEEGNPGEPTSIDEGSGSSSE